jgi:hypothetical protein
MRTWILLQMWDGNFLKVIGETHGKRSSFTLDVNSFKTKGAPARQRVPVVLPSLMKPRSMWGRPVQCNAGKSTTDIAVSSICFSLAYSPEVFTYESWHTSCSWHRLWSRTTNTSNKISSVTFKSSWKRITWLAPLGSNDEAIFQTRKI